MGLVQTILVVFGVIAIAYAAAHFKLLDERVGDGLSEFVFMIAAPLLLFRTMVTADFHGTAPWGLWIAYFSGVTIAWAASDIAIKLLFGRDNRAGVVAGVSGSFSNLVFLGMPLVLGVFGQPGFAVLSLIVAVHMPIMMAASICLHEVALRRDKVFDGEHSFTAVVRSFFTSLLRNPFVLGILGGWLWRFAGLPMPQTVDALIGTLASVAGPVALFAMGMGLKKFGVSGNIAAGLAMSVIKLMIMPAAVLGAVLLLGLPAFTAKIAVVSAGLPAGVNSYLIATRFGTGQALASNSMVMATGLSAASLLFWIFVVTHIYG
ncbi:AEC family transporter [Phyllobacterium sp. 21LDTY02-6]|uniref:AEC family transporter n=1 Tax=Phyllobacterium sp. 21LDTY02-6 TaxID=2944903 RepID=UPI00201FC321|nr:AEC family transporter [Phyllobacterium sp. 21LDTY02-6]MCO4316130.1 AEC family transporter [Phyllobacterium sp. 21LDTY02-6]